MKVQHKTFSRISLDKLQNKTDCSSSSVLKNDRLLETIHGRFEHITAANFVLVGGLMCSDVLC